MSDYSSFSDTELIVLLRQKDEFAFTEIYRRHWHMLYLHARKILGHEDEAKDLVQDLFSKFWIKAQELDVKTNLKGYLYMAVRNSILNFIRKQKVNHDFIDLIAAQMNENDNATVEGIDERELISLINAEIEQLPPKMKYIFELSRKEFLSNKEIATQLNMTEDAVKKQISRAIQLLRLKLGNYAGISLILLSVLHQKQ